MTPENNKHLLLLVNFVRALNHQVRTPLSIISNDLSYLQSLVDPKECERALIKCRQISELLRPPEILTTGVSNIFVVLDLDELFAQSIPAGKIEGKLETLSGNSELINQAFKWLSELFPSSQFISKKRIISIIPPNPPHADLTSFTEIRSESHSDDTLFPMYIDAILWAHGCTITSSNKEINIHFPYQQNDER